MADDSTQETAPETGANDGTEQAAEATVEVPVEVTRALKKANKEAETLRLKLKEYEDRDKTEQEKLAERASVAEQSASDARLELLRFKVASQNELPSELAELLKGSSEEELQEHAARLQAVVNKTASPTSVDFDGGVRDVLEQAKTPEAAHSDFLLNVFGRSTT